MISQNEFGFIKNDQLTWPFKVFRYQWRRLKTCASAKQIIEFALFGSVLRDDFKASSDVDVLITFAPHARKGLLTLAQIKLELEALLGREVDVLTKKIPRERTKSSAMSQHFRICKSALCKLISNLAIYKRYPECS